MNGYEMIYRPEEGSREAKKTHDCRPSESLDYIYEIKNPQGTIVCCEKCGQHWFAHIWKSGNLYTTKWYKVRWWNFIKRRRIVGK